MSLASVSPLPPITHDLHAMQQGDADAAERFWARINPNLRQLAARVLGRPGAVLQPTVLVNEAWLKLSPQKDARYDHSADFLRVAAEVMRRLIVDALRRDRALKRGGGAIIQSLDDDPPARSRAEILALDEALELLAQAEPRWAAVVEMKFFASMTTAEIAQALGVSTRTVEGDWKFARAWLGARMRRSQSIGR